MPFNGMGVGHRQFGSIPILENAFQNRMSVELPLSIKIFYVKKLVTNIVMTRESLWGCSTPLPFVSSKVMVAASRYLGCLVWGLSVVNTS